MSAVTPTTYFSAKDLATHVANHPTTAVTSLVFSGTKSASDADLAAIGTTVGASLTSLDVGRPDSGVKITDKGVATFVETVPELTSLSLAGASKVGSGAAVALAAACPNLIHLNLAQAGRLTDSGLAAVAGSAFAGRLETLVLSQVGGVSSTGLVGLLAATVSLTALDVSYLAVVGDEVLATVAAAAGSSLASLNLAHCENVTDEGVLALARVPDSGLASLNVTSCEKLSSVALDAVALGCVKLSSLLKNNIPGVISTRTLVHARNDHARWMAGRGANEWLLGENAVLVLAAAGLLAPAHVAAALAAGVRVGGLVEQSSGHTVLHKAALHQAEATGLIEGLVVDGADPFAVDADGRLPVDLAETPASGAAGFTLPMLHYVAAPAEVSSLAKARLGQLALLYLSLPSSRVTEQTLDDMVAAGLDLSTLVEDAGSRGTVLHVLATRFQGAAGTLVAHAVSSGADPFRVDAHGVLPMDRVRAPESGAAVFLGPMVAAMAAAGASSSSENAGPVSRALSVLGGSKSPSKVITGELLAEAAGAGVDLNRGSPTLLHALATRATANAELIAAAVALGADPYVVDDKGAVPYTSAPDMDAAAAVFAPLLAPVPPAVAGSPLAAAALCAAVRANPGVPLTIEQFASLVGAGGCSVNAVEPGTGLPVLHLAVRSGSIPVVMMLLASGANPWVVGPDGAHPHTYIEHRTESIVNYGELPFLLGLVLGVHPVPAAFTHAVTHAISSSSPSSSSSAPSSAPSS